MTIGDGEREDGIYVTCDDCGYKIHIANKGSNRDLIAIQFTSFFNNYRWRQLEVYGIMRHQCRDCQIRKEKENESKNNRR